MDKFRAFTFTINNYTKEDESSLLNLGHRYIVYGREVGDSGTPHLQGYICFRSQRSFASIKSKMPRAHIEQARGDSDANFKYCTKDGDFVEDGDRPASKKEQAKLCGDAERQRWDDAKTACKEGRLDDIDFSLWIKHDKAFERYAKRHKPEPRTVTHHARHFWFYGPPGTGKSHSARMVGQHLGWRTYLKDPQSKWWDGYEGEEIVIIDDFDKYQVKQGGDLKRWMDIYPFQAETKGTQMLIRPKVIIVTSNYAPQDIWTDEITVTAIGRRVHQRLLNNHTFAIKPEEFAEHIANIIKTEHSLCTQEEQLPVVKEGERHGDVALEDTV